MARPLALSARTAFQPALDMVRAAWGPRTKAVVIGSPSNPTGTTIAPAELERIARFVAGRGGVLIADSGAGRIYAIRGDAPTAWLEHELLDSVNGLLPEPDRLIVTTMAGRLLSIDYATRAITTLAEGLGDADGIAALGDGRYLVSEWPGRIFEVAPDGGHALQRNGELLGEPDAGDDMQFDFPRLIAHAAKTLPLAAGAIIGSGTVSNRDRKKGAGRLFERRAEEILKGGKAKTPFLKFGDRVRIEMLGPDGKSVFGAIDQAVVQAA